jgi:hypothetical protein
LHHIQQRSSPLEAAGRDRQLGGAPASGEASNAGRRFRQRSGGANLRDEFQQQMQVQRLG